MTMRAGEYRRMLQTHLLLGRISNVPTVWSNCLAAWVLARGGFTPALISTMAAMTCMYVGGMYLNDACDAPHDARHKPERPIPRGEIHRTTVFSLALALLAVGLLLSLGWGWASFLGAFALGLAIAAYNSLHLYFVWSPVLMGLCRMLVYVAVGLAAGGDHALGQLLVWSLALGAYVIGLSFVARVEEGNVFTKWGLLALVFVPTMLNLFPLTDPGRLLVGLLPLGWTAYCLVWILHARRRNLKRAVSGLIAGIALVDLLAASQITSPNPVVWQGLILACFGLTLLGQKHIPAT